MEVNWDAGLEAGETHYLTGFRQSKKFKRNYSKTKRMRFTIAKKVEILDLVKSNSIPRTEICKNYKITSSTLHLFFKFERQVCEHSFGEEKKSRFIYKSLHHKKNIQKHYFSFIFLSKVSK